MTLIFYDLPAQIVSPNQVRVDSVLNEYYSFLETSLLIRDTLSSQAFENEDILKRFEMEDSIMNMLEQLTGIEVTNYLHHYALARELDNSIIRKWRKWTDKNRSLILWDSKNQRLDRLDGSLYKE